MSKPEGLILVKGDSHQGQGNELFGIWPSGYTRLLTQAEWTAWGYPDADYTIAYGSDAEFLQLVAYDKALRA
jgi:hypothetical protein